MSARDRCSISAFNASYHQIATMADEGTSIAAMFALTQMCNGATHLYDAIRIAVRQFIEQVLL